jgi:hypothetical protein
MRLPVADKWSSEAFDNDRVLGDKNLHKMHCQIYFGRNISQLILPFMPILVASKQHAPIERPKGSAS